MFCVCKTTLSQTGENGILHLQSFHGEVWTKGMYRDQYSLIGDIEEDQRSIYFLGGVRLNTLSYMWSPDIVSLNLDAEYSPESRNEQFLLTPDRTEVRTLKRLDFRLSLLRNRKVNLSSYINFGQSYFNRELLTNIKSDTRQYGAIISVNNRFLPLSVSYRNSGWKQNETETGRIFSMNQENLLGRITKSFGQSDRNELIISHDNYMYSYSGSEEIRNTVDKAGLNNSLYFDKARKYGFTSQVAYYDQRGDYEFARLEAVERLMFQLPANFRFTGGYTFQMLDDPYQKNTQNRVSFALNHRLFESLTSDVFTDYSAIDNTSYEEITARAGFGFMYSKKVPAGRLNLSYRFSSTWFDSYGVSGSVRIMNEEHTLSDGQITVLSKPYVDLRTLVIKDQAGVIQYEADFDYRVFVRNNYTEIQRIPGGQIQNNQVILADYSAQQPGAYSFESSNHTFYSALLLFNNLIEIYYRSAVQDYRNLNETDFITLNYYNQNIAGGRIDLGFAGFGAEYDSYKSNIIPYNRLRYFVDLNWSPNSKFLIGLNGNLLDYRMIDNSTDQRYANITGKIACKITARTRIDLEGAYLTQAGSNIDLRLITSKLWLSTLYRQLLLKGGLELYQRHYLESDFFTSGIYIEIVRKF